MGGPRPLLGFDFGLRRIGLAAGDTLTGTARPLATVANGKPGPDWAVIARHIGELQPALLVVGTPYNVDGSPGALAAPAREFAAELERRFGIPVATVDERWSSLEAGQVLRERRASGARRRTRREDIDSAAAAVILERWLAGEKGE